MECSASISHQHSIVARCKHITSNPLLRFVRSVYARLRCAAEQRRTTWLDATAKFELPGAGEAQAAATLSVPVQENNVAVVSGE